jgi:hypothetical protein
MFGNSAHVLHDKLRTSEDMSIETLKNELPLIPCIECHEKSVIDITAPERINGSGCAGCSKPTRNGNKIVRGFVIHSVIFC